MNTERVELFTATLKTKISQATFDTNGPDVNELDEQTQQALLKFVDLIHANEQRMVDTEHLPQVTFISSRIIAMTIILCFGAVVWGRPNLLCIYIPSSFLSMIFTSCLWPLTCFDWWVWRNNIVLVLFILSLLNTIYVFVPFLDDTINWFNNVAGYHHVPEQNPVYDLYYGVNNTMTDAEVRLLYESKGYMESWLDTIIWLYALTSVLFSMQSTWWLYKTRVCDLYYSSDSI